MLIRTKALGPIAMLALLGEGGCGNSSLGQSPTIAGMVQQWTKGTGYTMMATVSKTTIGTGPIDGSGNFSLVMTGSPAATSQLALATQIFAPESRCTGQVTVSQPAARIGIAGFAVVKGASSTDVSLDSGTMSGTGAGAATYVTYVYADQATSVSGQINCPSARPPTSTQYYVSLDAGWNIVCRDENFTSTSSQSVVENSAPPSDAEWLLNM